MQSLVRLETKQVTGGVRERERKSATLRWHGVVEIIYRFVNAINTVRL